MNPFTPYLPIDRLHALANATPLPDRVQGAALFVDISGFTPLTAALAAEMGRQRGAEAVLNYINPIFEALIERLHAYGGSVISFAGDSITCWLDQDDGQRAAHCAYEMQTIMQQFASLRTPGGTLVPMSIKVGVAAGPARRFLAGNPAIHNFEALAGKTIERMAAAESQAKQGDVILSREVVIALGPQAEVAEWRADTMRPEAPFAVLARPLPPGIGLHPWPPLANDALQADALRAWIDAPVYERLLSGATFLAELRPVTALFVKFSGIDYDSDEHAGEKLDAFIRQVQTVLARYDGAMLQLTIGDKGSNLLAVFGAPVAHDDDAARAAAAALDLLTRPAGLDFIQPLQIGLSQGLSWAGAVGGALRCIYTVMGDEINMAARLMSKAQPGQALANQMIVNATQPHFQYHALGLIAVKGREQPLPVSALTGYERSARRTLSALFESPLVGREATLAQMQAVLALAHQGRGQVLRLEGPPGVGKSHLTSVFCAQALREGWQMAAGACSSTARHTPYTPWQQALASLFDLGGVSPESYFERLRQVVLPANPAWENRLPLLGDILGVAFPETATTAGLEPKQRREALFALVTEILQTWANCLPLLIVIEDVHWLDEPSQALTTALGQALACVPALLLIVQRPALSGESLLPELAQLESHHAINLGDLTPQGIHALVANRLGTPLSPLAAALLSGRAQGNPFFAEELAGALCEAGYWVQQAGRWELSSEAHAALLNAGCLVKVDGEWQMIVDPPLSAARLALPDTVNATVLARLDRLPEDQKLTLKTASVIGRSFSLDLLQAIHPAAPAPEVLQRQIEAAMHSDFVHVETPGPTPVYIFKHNTTQEVAYSAMLFAQRRELHGRVGAWYETRYGDRPLSEQRLDSPLAPYFPLLAYHWQQAEDDTHERVFATLAAEQAAKKYANESALRYFNRALELAPADDLAGRWKLLLGREDVNDVLADRQAQSQDLSLLQHLSADLGQAQHCRLLLRQARYGDYVSDTGLAFESIRAAAELAAALQDSGLQTEALHAWGRLLWKNSAYPEALERLQQALALAERSGDRLQAGRCWMDLATTYREQSNTSAAIETYHKARQIYAELDYTYGEIGCLINLGNIHADLGSYLAAEAAYLQAQRLSRAIGLRYPESYCLGALGANAFDLGDYPGAERFYRQALIVAQEIGNRISEAAALDSLSLVETLRGDYAAACAYAQLAIEIQTAINRPRSLAYSLNHLGLAQAAAGNAPAAQAAFEQALQIRLGLKQYVLALDDQAGLARLALARGDASAARQQAEAILAAIAEHGVESCEFPVWVYLSCYQALQAAGADTAAQQALQAGQALLETRAAQIHDAGMRRQFLEQVPFNRAIMASQQAS